MKLTINLDKIQVIVRPFCKTIYQLLSMLKTIYEIYALKIIKLRIIVYKKALKAIRMYRIRNAKLKIILFLIFFQTLAILFKKVGLQFEQILIIISICFIDLKFEPVVLFKYKYLNKTISIFFLFIIKMTLYTAIIPLSLFTNCCCIVLIFRLTKTINLLIFEKYKSLKN